MRIRKADSGKYEKLLEDCLVVDVGPCRTCLDPRINRCPPFQPSRIYLNEEENWTGMCVHVATIQEFMILPLRSKEAEYSYNLTVFLSLYPVIPSSGMAGTQENRPDQ